MLTQLRARVQVILLKDNNSNSLHFLITVALPKILFLMFSFVFYYSALTEEDYYVKVVVDGEPVPDSLLCNGRPTSSDCTHSVMHLSLSFHLFLFSCIHVAGSDFLYFTNAEKLSFQYPRK